MSHFPVVNHCAVASNTLRVCKLSLGSFSNTDEVNMIFPEAANSLTGDLFEVWRRAIL